MRTEQKFGIGIILLLILIICTTTALAIVPIQLSDQGTSVKQTATGQILNTGNLSVEIYDADAGGNLLWNRTYYNAIVNGSWNVMLGELNELNLSYGEKYYKDYKINDFDINFTNGTGGLVDRRAFYSPLGAINKTYIENASDVFVDILGDTMTGQLTVNTNLSVSNITPINADWGVTIRNGSGGKIVLVNTTSGRLEVWNPLEGANDYLSISHDGTDTDINAQSGLLTFQRAGVDQYIIGSGVFYPATANTHSLGITTNEWLAQYLGEDTSSGTYYGLDQNWRIWHNSSTNFLTLDSGSTNRMVINSTSGYVGIGTANPSSPLHVYGDTKDIAIDFPSTTSFGYFNFKEAGVAQGDITLIGSGFATVARRGDIELSNTGDITLQPINGNFVGIGTTAPAMGLHIGTGSSSHSLTNKNDTFVTGNFETDGTNYFDGASNFASTTTFNDNVNVAFGSAYDSVIDWSTAQATSNSVVWGLGNLEGNSIIFTTNTLRDDDYDHPSQTNPTIFVQANEDPDGNNDRWISITHDNSSGVIDSGYGQITLDDTAFVSGNLSLSDNVVGTTMLDIYDDGSYLVFNSTNDVKMGNDMTVLGNLNVTGTSYLGNLVLQSENISTTNILPLNAVTGVTVRNGSGGKLIFANTTSGRLEVWNPLAGANDYVSVYHDGTNAGINTGSGPLYLGSASGWMYWDGNILRSDTANADDLGATAQEWRAGYYGEDASSGTYYGLDQDWRMYYNETSADKLYLEGLGNFEVRNSTGSSLRVNTSNGYTDIINPVDGTYGSIWHDSYLRIQDTTSSRIYFYSTTYAGEMYPNGANMYNLGSATGEWKAIYLGNGTSSGISFGMGQESNLLMSNAQATAPTMIWGTPSTNAYGNSIILADNARITSDYDHPAQTNPTLFVQSLENPDANNDRWISMTHDNTSAVIDSGYGNITLDDTSFLSGNLEIADNLVGTLAAEIGDDGTNFIINSTKPMKLGNNVTIYGDLNVTGTAYIGNGTSIITASSVTTHTINVTETAYLANAVINTENLTITNLFPKNANTGVLVRNGSGGKLGFFNTTSGKLEVWSPLEGANDYVSMYHDGTSGYFSTASGNINLNSQGNILFTIGGTNYWVMDDDQFYPAYSNSRDIGTTSYELRAQYMGEDALSGIYYGLDQDAKTYYNTSQRALVTIAPNDNVSIVTKQLDIWDDAEGANDYVSVYHDLTDTYIVSRSGNMYLQAGNNLAWDGTNVYVGTINLANLGTTSNEWRSLYLGNGTTSSGVFFGNDQSSTLFYSNNQTNGPTMVWGLDNAYGNSLVLTTNTNRNKDHDHPAQTTPTLFVQSQEDPDANNDRWASLTHDNTSAVIDSGYGNITLDDTTLVGGDLQVADNVVGTTSMEMWDDGTYIVFNTTRPLYSNGVLYVDPTTSRVGIGTTAPSVALHVAGEANITGINGDGTGKAVCIKADQTLGTCSDAVGAGGTCTCA